MAWEEQRRLRGAGGAETAKIEGLPVASTPAPDAPESALSAPLTGRGVRAGRWGQRFGWIAAVAVALVALIFALLAFTNSDATSHVRRHAGGFAPYGRADDGFGRVQPPGPRPGDAQPR